MHTLKKHWIKITIAVYLSCILGYTLVFSIFNWGNLAPLTSNELGDFLSGSFAPLAFFILIMGYIQQGRELQQNTAALQLQADELRNSVEQQKLLLETAKEDLNLAKAQNQAQYKKELTLAQPFIHFEVKAIKQRQSNFHGLPIPEDKFDKLSVALSFSNTRGLARELKVHVTSGKFFHEEEYPFLGTDIEGKYFALKFSYPQCFENGDLNLEYVFKYLDELDIEQEQVFVVTVEKEINEAVLPIYYIRESKTY